MAPPTVFDKAVSERELLKLQLRQYRIKAGKPNLTVVSIDHLLSKLETITNEITANYRQIVAGCDPADSSAHEAEYTDRTEEIYEAEVHLKEERAILSIPNSSSSSSSTTAASTSGTDIKLPKLELPKFNGNLGEWLSFRDLFLTSVHNNAKLSNAQKLSYLQGSLIGEAAKLTKSMSITDANYTIAWDLVQKRYQNERELIYSILKRLVNQPAVQADSAQSLRCLVDTNMECKRALQVLNVPVDHWDAILGFLVLHKLDKSSTQAYELTLNTNDIPKFDDMLAYLENRSRALGADFKGTSKSTKPNHDAGKKQQFHHISTNSYEHKCKICNDLHYHFKCPKLLAFSVPERKECVKRLSLCFNCLRDGHTSCSCQSKRTCQKCQKRHHSLLHVDTNTATASASTSVPNDAPLSHGHTTETSHNSTSMLATAVVKIIDSRNDSQLCRTFLDPGSNSSLITESCARRLGLKFSLQRTEMTGVGGTSLGFARGSVSFVMKPRFKSDETYAYEINAFVVSKITSRLPYVCSVPVEQFSNLKLADPCYYKPADVDILLGTDLFYTVLKGGKKQGLPGTPIAVNSTLGWLVGGNLLPTTAGIHVHHVNLIQMTLDERLQSFWELEEIPKKRILTEDEKQCEDHFLKTYTRNPEGRMVVELPFKSQHKSLGYSRENATRRLKCLEKRLALHPDLRSNYNAFMKEYVELGHMIPIPTTEEIPSKSYYIPHQCVFKESSTTTKFRVVFDASAKTSSGQSLNDILMAGPTIQDSVVTLLTRFRSHKIAFTADLAKFYRQIEVSAKHQDFQRILWREDSSLPIQEYKLCTVTYGTAPGAFCSTRALQQLAIEEGSELPLAAKVVREDFYVDDLMTGGENVLASQNILQELLELMKRGGLCLRKFSSNSPEFLECLPAELRATQEPLEIHIDQTVKILGISWNPSSDVFNFKVSLPKPKAVITKRILLSEVAKIFDPLGWLAPVVIKAKIMFQDLWKLKDLNWDDSLPEDIQTRWLEYRNTLHHIEQLNIRRCFSSNTLNPKYYLHGFSDASEKAYSACVYVLSQAAGDPVASVTLIAAKTRVAPMNTISLPRLELCGAVLLVDLMESVKDSLHLKFEDCRAWTDSTIVLNWINSPASRWKTFVANRVCRIQEVISAKSWGHVGGLENPADCASRGIDPGELTNHPLWWTGPTWLSTNTYPIQIPANSVDDSTGERTPKILVSATFLNNSMVHKFSTLTKLKRVTAWCLRFYNNCKAKIPKSNTKIYEPLTANELETALRTHIKCIQYSEIPEVKKLKIALISKNETKSHVMTLNPFFDTDGILRVGGRLNNAELTTDKKFPIILPHHHHLTKLIIQHEHINNFHSGPQLTLASIQSKYWIIRAKDAVRHQIKKCVRCARYGAQLQQQMGNLPASRINPCRAFLKCGVDYAGPFTLRPIPGRSKVTFKGYLAVFVCFVTKAIHLEIVSSLSTEAFIACLRRFVARRGKPSDVYSDNGTNFVGAAKELKELLVLFNSDDHNHAVADHLSSEGIQWHFNPPGAPHFGGLWEAGVKSVKYHLTRICNSTNLTYEEFGTLSSQIESCLNSRPLTPISNDPNDLSFLTPGHFLIGDSLKSIPDPDLTNEKLNSLSRWQLVQRIQQHFWHRWTSEYLTRLQQRPKWLNQRDNIQLNDLVLIKDDKYAVNSWPMGRVISVHPGKDGHTRVVTLRTSNGELTRPISKLCLLPVEEAQSSTALE